MGVVIGTSLRWPSRWATLVLLGRCEIVQLQCRKLKKKSCYFLTHKHNKSKDSKKPTAWRFWLMNPFPVSSADERFDATFHTNVLVNASGHCQYLPPGKIYSLGLHPVRKFKQVCASVLRTAVLREGLVSQGLPSWWEDWCPKDCPPEERTGVQRTALLRGGLAPFWLPTLPFPSELSRVSSTHSRCHLWFEIPFQMVLPWSVLCPY